MSKQARIYREAPSPPPPKKNESKLLCKITENMRRKPHHPGKIKFPSDLHSSNGKI